MIGQPKNPTSSEWKVVGFIFIVIPIILGLILIFYGWSFADENIKVCKGLIKLGFSSIGISLFICFIGKIL